VTRTSCGFRVHARGSGLAPTTIRRQCHAHTYFNFLIGEGILADDPSDRLESPKRWRSLPDVLTTQEMELLLAAPSLDEPLAWRDRALLELGYGAGLRVTELCTLGTPDLLFADGLVRVFGKGGKERLVPIGRKVIGAVSVYLNQTRPALTGKEAARAFQRLGAPRVGLGDHSRSARAGITKRVSPHPAALATHLLEGGADLRSARDARYADPPPPRSILTSIGTTSGGP
jgi:integrase/recombinase XerD